MEKILSIYNPKIIGTIYENGKELEVEFLPDEDKKEEFQEKLFELLSEYDTGTLVN